MYDYTDANSATTPKAPFTGELNTLELDVNLDIDWPYDWDMYVDLEREIDLPADFVFDPSSGGSPDTAMKEPCPATISPPVNDEKNDILISMMGMTGAGKSTFISSIGYDPHVLRSKDDSDETYAICKDLLRKLDNRSHSTEGKDPARSAFVTTPSTQSSCQLSQRLDHDQYQVQQSQQAPETDSHLSHTNPFYLLDIPAQPSGQDDGNELHLLSNWMTSAFPPNIPGSQSSTVAPKHTCQDESATPRKRHKKNANSWMCHYPECGQRFDRKCDLNKHVKRKHSQGSHPCGECTKSFHDRKDWKRHILSVHPSTEAGRQLLAEMAEKTRSSPRVQSDVAQSKVLPELAKRDHVFWIDNLPMSSRSLHTDVKDVVSIMSFLIQEYDPDGIDLSFRPQTASVSAPGNGRRKGSYQLTNRERIQERNARDAAAPGLMLQVQEAQQGAETETRSSKPGWFNVLTDNAWHECQKTFGTINDVRRHRAVHDLGGSFTCLTCFVAFHCPDHFERHMAWRHPGSQGYGRDYDRRPHFSKIIHRYRVDSPVSDTEPKYEQTCDRSEALYERSSSRPRYDNMREKALTGYVFAHQRRSSRSGTRERQPHSSARAWQEDSPRDAKDWRTGGRESHNMVERTRCDNVDEHIADLAKLVPPHGLECGKIKKYWGTPSASVYDALVTAISDTGLDLGPLPQAVNDFRGHMQGLAMALAALHQSSALRDLPSKHGDLKPENILWSGSRNTSWFDQHTLLGGSVSPSNGGTDDKGIGEQIAHRMQQLENDCQELPRPEGEQSREGGSPDHFFPAHAFDFVCETSTEGLIAIMLGRLRMSVPEALDMYQKVHTRLMPGDYGQDLVLETVKYRGDQYLRVDQLLQDWYARGWTKQLLPLSELVSGQQTSCPRQYSRPYTFIRPEPSDELKIWEVARATSAAPSYFRSAAGIINCTFEDGILHCNDPTGFPSWSWHRFEVVDGSSSTSDVLLPIGTGEPPSPHFKRNRTVLQSPDRLSTTPAVSKAIVSSLDRGRLSTTQISTNQQGRVRIRLRLRLRVRCKCNTPDHSRETLVTQQRV